MEELIKDTYQLIDEFEAVLEQGNLIECPLVHRFTPGLYVRELHIPAGTILTSKIHRTEHPFIISKGKISVMINGEVEIYEAPYCGITKPGTRRVLYAITDVVWLTAHATDKKTPEEVEEDIIEPYDNPLLSDETKIKNNLNRKQCH